MSGHVLVVEDDADIRETVGDLLEEQGYTVTLAENGARALQRLNEAEALPDLILLDLMMPVMDGHEFRIAQRADPRYARIPVVVMSADPRLDAHRERLEARSYVRKPFHIGALLAAIAAIVGG